jgi:hypothetical protein
MMNGSGSAAGVLRLLVFAILSILANGGGKAAPLTFYTDQTAWLSAVSGLNIAPYPFPVTRTDFLTTIKLDPFCCIVLGHSTVTTQQQFSSFSANFTFASGCEFTPPCVITAPQEVLITFPTPISGFASNSPEFDFLFSSILLNGQPLPPILRDNFFGVVGPITSLDFVSGSGFTDNHARVFLGSIVVATVDEPSSFLSLTAGLCLLGIAFSRVRWREALGKSQTNS